MKHFWVACIFVILFCIRFVVQAQTPEPLPSAPPDPDEIFGAGVQWLLVESPAPAEQQPIEIDSSRRVIRVTTTQREYPFPPHVDSVYEAVMLPDGLIQLRVNPNIMGDVRPGDLLLLVPRMGLYAPPPTVCRGQVIQAEPGKGTWTIAYLDANHAVLCNSETDEERDVLPSGLTEWQAFPSPDGAWLILMARTWTGLDDFQIYAYQMNADRMTALGTIGYEIDSDVSICGWVSATQGLLCRSSTHVWMGTTYYAFDVTRTNSIEYAFWDGHGENVFHLEKPAVRYVSVLSDDYQASITGGRSPNHPPCTLTIYDVAGLRQHELAYECIPIMLDQDNRSPYYSPGNTLYYLTFDSPDATVSSLRSYSLEAEAGNVALFTGEIENILSVSPDNRYVVLLLDDNGKLDFRWQGLCCNQWKGWQVAILDTTTEQIVYHSEPVGVYADNQAMWSDDTTLIFGTAQDYEQLRADDNGGTTPNTIPASLRRINLDKGVNISSTTQAGLDRYSGMNLDRLSSGGWRYWLREDNTVIDLRTFEAVPILRNDIPQQYTLRLNWAVDGDLEVHVSIRESNGEAIYRVRLD